MDSTANTTCCRHHLSTHASLASKPLASSMPDKWFDSCVEHRHGHKTACLCTHNVRNALPTWQAAATTSKKTKRRPQDCKEPPQSCNIIAHSAFV